MKKTVNISNYLDNISLKSTSQLPKYKQQYEQSMMDSRHVNQSQKNANNLNRSSFRAGYNKQIGLNKSEEINVSEMKVSYDQNTSRHVQPSKLQKYHIGDHVFTQSTHRNNNYTYSPYYNRPNQQIIMSKSLQQNEKQLQDCLDKLKQIKLILQKQINSLQHLLDETSTYLQSSQEEFLKIKTKILQYTSKYLDAAFQKYKKNMTKWSKYEEAERKGIEVTLQMKDCIEHEGRVLQQAIKQKDNSKLENSIKYTKNLISHYRNMHVQLQKIRLECLSKHPTINLNKIQNFQRSLEELCIF